MEHPEDEKANILKFFRQSEKRLRRLPKSPINITDPVVRPVLFGIGAGLLDNWAINNLEIFNKSGLRDEISIVLAILAGLIFGSIRKLRMLCADDESKELAGKIAATGGGAFVGVGAITIPVIDKSAMLIGSLGLTVLDLGVSLGVSLVAMGIAYLINKKKKKSIARIANIKATARKESVGIVSGFFTLTP